MTSRNENENAVLVNNLLLLPFVLCSVWCSWLQFFRLDGRRVSWLAGSPWRVCRILRKGDLGDRLTWWFTVDLSKVKH